MKKITIAFDVEGTLIRNSDDSRPVANERIRTLLVTLASFKNIHITVWSSAGEQYARQMCSMLGLYKYVDEYMGKNLVGTNPDGSDRFEPGITPDIAIDDSLSCELGNINLIVGR